MDGWEDSWTTPVTPARRGADVALEASVEKVRRQSDAPQVLSTPAQSTFDDHLRRHRDKACTKCTYAINRVAWEAMASLPDGRTWLQPQPVDAANWWVSCSICSAGRLMRLQGKSLHLGNIRQHARSKGHAQACSNNPAAAAPATGKFAEALKSAGVGHQVSEPPRSIFQESYMVRCRSHPRWTPCLLSLPLLSCLMRETTACLAPVPGLH